MREPGVRGFPPPTTQPWWNAGSAREDRSRLGFEFQGDY